MANRKARMRCGVALTALCCAVLSVAAVGLFSMRTASDSTPPSPMNEVQQCDANGFSAVDWGYWMSVNPDIIGWITVPGTSIDTPVVQAQPEDPQRYLRFDIYGNWNYYGAAYLDAGCASEGLGSKNSVIYAHNMGGDDKSMFGDLARFSDPEYAASHSIILIQTPDWKEEVSAKFVDVAKGWESKKRVFFDDAADFESWYRERYEEARLKITSETADPWKNYTLCTCSYNYWDNERTLVFAS